MEKKNVGAQPLRSEPAAGTVFVDAQARILNSYDFRTHVRQNAAAKRADRGKGEIEYLNAC
jgi:hypothetical protein